MRLLHVTVNKQQLTSDGRSLPPGCTEINLEGPSTFLLFNVILLNVTLSFDQGYLLSGLTVKCDNSHKSYIKR